METKTKERQKYAPAAGRPTGKSCGRKPAAARRSDIAAGAQPKPSRERLRRAIERWDDDGGCSP